METNRKPMEPPKKPIEDLWNPLENSPFPVVFHGHLAHPEAPLPVPTPLRRRAGGGGASHVFLVIILDSQLTIQCGTLKIAQLVYNYNN